MKDFKVRAWNIQQNKYLDVFCLKFLTDGIEVGVKVKDSTIPTYYPTDENILEFYTGQKDADGVDIYVGDVLSTIEGRPRIVNVIWSKQSVTFGCVDINAESDDLGINGNQTLDSLLKSYGGKITGNIH